MIKKPAYGPKCPNHHEFLEGIGFPIPSKGTGICPVSGCPFDFEIDVEEEHAKEVKDKFGVISEVSEWKLSGEEK